MFVRYGNTQGVPWWVTALLLAERGWGHPEDISKKRGGIVWAARQGALDEAREYWRKFDSKKS